MRNNIIKELYWDFINSSSICVILDIIVIVSSYSLYYDIHEQLHPNDFYFHLWDLLVPLTLINFAIGFYVKEKKGFFYVMTYILLSLLLCAMLFLFIGVIFSGRT